MVRNDDFAKQVKDKLAHRVGHKCSNPNCKRPTSGPNLEGGSVNIGVAAHISAASQGGPRFDAQMPSAVRCSIENAIWLCQSCAKLIDNDPQKYSVEYLQRWKESAEEQSRRDLETRVLIQTEEIDLEMNAAQKDILIGALEGYEGNMIVYRELNGWDVVSIAGENYNTNQQERTLYVDAMLRLIDAGLARRRGGGVAYELTFNGLKNANELKSEGIVRNKPGHFS